MKDKWVPEVMLALNPQTGQHEYSPVISVLAHAPGHKVAPIRTECTAVEITLANGGKRYFGFERAWIDSHLRMRVSGYDERNELVAAWPDAKE
jgi:hypothetical protein